jgi:hypothetical protein
MKKLFAALILCVATFSSVAHGIEYDPYGFVKNFELVGITVDGSRADITVKVADPLMPPRFEVIPNAFCIDTLPRQCSATIVRLDNAGSLRDLKVEMTFSVDLEYLFGSDRTIATIYGPNTAIDVSY